MLCSVIYTDPEPRSVVSDSRPLFSLPLIAAIRPLFPDHFLFPPKPFRINTYKSVTKQTSLTSFRINTYEKHRGRGCRPPRALGRTIPFPACPVPGIIPAHAQLSTQIR